MKKSNQQSAIIASGAVPNPIALGEIVDRYYRWLWAKEQKRQKARAAGRGRKIAVVKV